MIPALKRLVRQQDPVLADAKVDFVKLHNGVGFRNPKVSFITFIDGQPKLFLKSVRFPADNPVIDRAHDALKNAQSAAEGIQGVRIPEAKWIASEGRVRVSAESVLEGRPLEKTSATETSRALEWLDAYAAKCVGPMMDAGELRTVYDWLVQRMKSSDAEFLNEAKNLLESFLSHAGGESLTLPSVLAHGDFTPANLLVDRRGTLGIIDWDRYGDTAMPMFDTLTFIERITPKKENMFVFGKTAIFRHANALKIDPSAIPLVIFFYIIMSDWRKRERMFPWEPAQWDRDTLKLMREMLADAKQVFPW